MTKYQLMPVIAALTSILLLLGACSDKVADPFSSASMVNQLEDSQSLFQQNRSLPTEQKPLPSFDLIYEGNLEQLLADGGELDQLIEAHDLAITHSFDIDEAYKGLTLQADSSLKDALEVAKSLSLVNQVLMIEASHVKSQPTEEYL